MRIAFIGAGQVSVDTARMLIKKGHEVIIVDIEKERIDELSEQLDCSFLHGDGSRPDILDELNPPETDMLFCLTDSDQYNVIASLVGRSLGFSRVVTSISDPQFEEICRELGLEDTIIPSRTMSLYLSDLVSGKERLDMSTIVKDEARFFTFVAREEDAKKISELELPEESRIVCLYRDNAFTLPDDDMKLREGDEVVIIAHSKHVSELQERWAPEVKKNGQGEEKDGKEDS